MPGRVRHLNFTQQKLPLSPSGSQDIERPSHNRLFSNPTPRSSKPVGLKWGPEVCPKQPGESRQVMPRAMILRSPSLREGAYGYHAYQKYPVFSVTQTHSFPVGTINQGKEKKMKCPSYLLFLLSPVMGSLMRFLVTFQNPTLSVRSILLSSLTAVIFLLVSCLLRLSDACKWFPQSS